MYTRSIPDAPPGLGVFATGLTNFTSSADVMANIGRRIGMPDMNSYNAHMHRPSSEWHITTPGTFNIGSYPKLGYERLLRPGDLVWWNKPPIQTASVREENLILNEYCLNNVLHRHWQTANRALAPLLQVYRARGGRKAGDRSDFLDYLSLPEYHWHSLFGPTSDLNSTTDEYGLLAMLCVEGILSKFAPVGMMLVAPAASFPPSVPRTTSRQATLQFYGVTDTVVNVWGEKRPGAYCFTILKRYWDQNLQTYTQFALVPYSSLDKSVPLSELEYIGVSGHKETGVAFYRGRILDVKGEVPNDQTKRLLQGLDHTRDVAQVQQEHEQATTVKMYLDMGRRVS
jgi:hypothetical protein